MIRTKKHRKKMMKTFIKFNNQRRNKIKIRKIIIKQPNKIISTEIY